MYSTLKTITYINTKHYFFKKHKYRLYQGILITSTGNSIVLQNSNSSMSMSLLSDSQLSSGVSIIVLQLLDRYSQSLNHLDGTTLCFYEHVLLQHTTTFYQHHLYIYIYYIQKLKVYI